MLRLPRGYLPAMQYQHHDNDGKGGVDAPLSILGQCGEEHDQIALASAQRLGLDVLAGVQFHIPARQAAAQAMNASGIRVRLWQRIIEHQRHGGDDLILASARVLASAKDWLDGDGQDDEVNTGLRQAINAILRSGLTDDLVANWACPEALDDASWIHAAARIAPVIIWRPAQLLRVMAEREQRRRLEAIPHTPAQLHPGQEKALNFLETLMRARFARVVGGGIQLQGHGLIMGSSGSGKSFLARELAHRHGASFLALTIGGWLLTGQDRPHATLNLIGRWIRSLAPGKKGVLLVDEIDKMRATSSDNHNAIYVRSCFDEVLALLDGRVVAPEWSESILNRFRTDVVVLCAGAFQSLYQTDHEIILEEEWSEVTASTKVWDAGILPDELLMRLAPGCVEILPPGAAWLATKLQLIDVDVHGSPQLSVDDYRKEAGEMVRSKRNLRSLESYLLQAWTKRNRGRQAHRPPPASGLLDPKDDLSN